MTQYDFDKLKDWPLTTHLLEIQDRVESARLSAFFMKIDENDRQLSLEKTHLHDQIKEIGDWIRFLRQSISQTSMSPLTKEQALQSLLAGGSIDCGAFIFRLDNQTITSFSAAGQGEIEFALDGFDLFWTQFGKRARIVPS